MGVSQSILGLQRQFKWRNCSAKSKEFVFELVMYNIYSYNNYCSCSAAPPSAHCFISTKNWPRRSPLPSADYRTDPRRSPVVDSISTGYLRNLCSAHCPNINKATSVLQCRCGFPVNLCLSVDCCIVFLCKQIKLGCFHLVQQQSL